MTIKSIIDLLKKPGINSKQKVIDCLENAKLNDLIELRRDINERINLKESTNYKCYGIARPLRPNEKQYE